MKFSAAGKLKRAGAKKNGRPLSRQRLWQIRHQRAGLCIKCGRKRINSTFCPVHAAYDLRRKTADYWKAKRKRKLSGRRLRRHTSGSVKQ